MRIPWTVSSLALLAVCADAACSPQVDLTRALQVETVSSGWLDAGLVDGKNKLVPIVSFSLKNVSDQRLAAVHVNAVFRRVGEAEDWGSTLLSAESNALGSGSATRVLKIRSPLGYTGLESQVDMLANSRFVDARVDVFAKYGSAQWTRLGEYPIARRLIPRLSPDEQP